MSVVHDRVEETKKKLRPELLDELETKKLSKILRRETWGDHERAQYSDFEVALAKGTISREAYRDLLAQMLFVYRALEERAEELKDDPVAGQIVIPELNRTAGVEADLAFYFGPDWKDEISQLPVTKEYVARVRNAGPVQFVAHHYTRYLADLSGGVMIDEALQKAWNLDLDGRRYYVFEDIPVAVDFKNTYRATLDELPVSKDQKLEMIVEAIAAYEYNIEVVSELAERYGVKA
jgi:heme oxygenase